MDAHLWHRHAREEPVPAPAVLSLRELRSLASSERERYVRHRRRWLLGLTRQGKTLNRETPGTIEAAVQRVLKTTTVDDLNVTRAVLSRLARELDGGRPSRAIH